MKLTFCSSLEENLAAAAGECAIMAAGGLVRADQAGPLGGEEELHGEGVLSAGLKPVVKHWRQEHVIEPHVGRNHMAAGH